MTEGPDLGLAPTLTGSHAVETAGPDGLADDFVDTEDGHRFRVVADAAELRGGQGTIERLVGTQLAVKRPKTDSAKANWNQARAREVRRLPLEDLDISRPLYMLQDGRGYVMHLIDGTRTVKTLIGDPRDQDRVDYHRCAGLRRRLRLLAGIAHAVARVHSRGLVYTDLSAGNVMVSELEPHEDVWLVDVDNVTVAGAAGGAPYTPGYEPPGFRPERVPSRLVDAHAFAVLAFRVLVQLHPLFGDGRPDHVDVTHRWIEHDDERERFAHVGLSRADVLTAELCELFRLCFDDGMRDPDARPDLATWARALYTAADDAVACGRCRRDRLGAGRCPWCGAALPRPLCAVLLDCLPGRAPVPARGAHTCVALAPRGTTSIEERHRTGRLGEGHLKPVLTVMRRGDRVEVQAASGRSCRLVNSGAARDLRRHKGRQIRPARAGDTIDVVHLGDPDVYHRGVAIVDDPRARASA